MYEPDSVPYVLTADKIYQHKFHTGGIVGVSKAINGLGAACKSGAFTINELKQALTVYQELSPIKELKSRCPGLNQIVRFPCDCHEGDAVLETLLIHLNDEVQWTREEIADWLDSLDVDLSVVIE